MSGARVVTSSTNQWALKIPAFTLWNLGLHYKWGGGSKIEHSLHLNVNNLLDKDYLKVNKNLGDARSIYLSYTVGFAGLMSH